MKPIFPIAAICAALAACGSVTSDRAVVTGLDDGEFLKLRAGPSLEFNVLLGLPEGTEVNRRDCVTELGQLWCEVSLVSGSGVTGFVAATYLSDR